MPDGSSITAAELRRRTADEAFERHCAKAAKQLERITDPEVLVTWLRNHDALDGALIIAIERTLASMSEATLARAEEYLYDVALSVTSVLMKRNPSPPKPCPRPCFMA